MTKENLSIETNGGVNELKKIGKLKNSRAYKTLATTATALVLAHGVQAANVDAGESFRNNQPTQQHKNTQVSDFFGRLGITVSKGRIDNENQRGERIDPNVETPDNQMQLDKLNKAINETLNRINNTSNHNERQQYINELNQLIQARDIIQGSNNNNNYSGNYNNYERNNSFSTIRTSFGSNSSYWSDHPDKNQRMKDLERNQVSYRFHDTKHSKQKFDKLTSYYQVDENGTRVGSFDKMLSNGESVLLKFVFKRRSETVQVSYNDRVLKVRPVGGRRTEEIYINRQKLKHKGGRQKIAFGKGANNDGDGFRMVLFVTIEN